MNSVICRATAEDAAAIARVHIRGWQAAYRGQLPDAYLDELDREFDHRAEMWRKMISAPTSNTHEVWLAAADSRVDGFVAIGPARGADESGSGEVYAIYVSPECWGQGFGRALMTQATERLNSSFPAAALWVLESNARARRFYEIAGWAADGGAKQEKGPSEIELREVRYRISFR